jgi:molybdenum cofactor cytidylyltransferase
MQTRGTAHAASGLFCIVLAAGASSRFGAAKQLSEFRHQPLVTRAMRLAEELCGQYSVLVAGNEWRRVAAACRPLAGYLVVNPDFQEGLAGSIAAGIGAVAETAAGAMLLLADQPLIDAQYLRSMVKIWQQNADCIIASEYADTTGPPAIFPASFFDRLTSLTGDHGARQILRDKSSPVIRLKCASAAVDIDEPGDLDAIVRDDAAK